MQTNTNRDRTGTGKLIINMFESGNPGIYLWHADEGEIAGDFASAGEVNAFIDAAIKAHKRFAGFTIRYPDAAVHSSKRIPQHCPFFLFSSSLFTVGKAFRFVCGRNNADMYSSMKLRETDSSM